jgi:hypothetical protein
MEVPVPRSQRKPDHDCDHLALVTDLLAGAGSARTAARATLRRIVDARVRSTRFPIGWLDASIPARQVIARLSWQRLEANRCALLREWCRRTLHGEDAATFPTMLATVILFVAAEYAEAMEPRG